MAGLGKASLPLAAGGQLLLERFEVLLVLLCSPVVGGSEMGSGALSNFTG